MSTASRPSPLFPFEYAPPRVVNGSLRTCRLVDIGILHQVQRVDDIGTSAEVVQKAMLAPPTLLERIKSELGTWSASTWAVAFALATGIVAVALDVLVVNP